MSGSGVCRSLIARPRVVSLQMTAGSGIYDDIAEG